MRGLRSKKRRLGRIFVSIPTIFVSIPTIFALKSRKILTNPLKFPILVGAKAQNKTTGEEPVVR